MAADNVKVEDIDFGKFAQYSMEKWYRTMDRLGISEYRNGIGNNSNPSTLRGSFTAKFYPDKKKAERIEYSYLFRGVFVELGVYKGVKKKDAGDHNKRPPKPWRHKTIYADAMKLKSLLERKYGADGAYMIKQIIEQ